MIKANDGKIRTRELMGIVILLFAVKLADTTPDTLFEFGKNAAWMMPLVSFLVLFIPFFILLGIVKRRKSGLVEIVFTLMGKRIGSAVMFILFLIIFSATVINSRNYVDIFNAMFYPKTPVPYLFIMLIGVSFYIANRGLENIGRTAWMFTPILIFLAYTLIGFVWEDLSFARIFPIAGPGLPSIIKEGVINSSIYIEILSLFAIYPFIKTHKNFRNGVLIGWVFSVLSLALFMIIYVAAFDFHASQTIAYPFQQLSRMASIGTIGHLESIFLAIWTIASAIHFSIYLYFSAFFLSKALNLKEFEPLLLPLSGLTVLLGLLSPNIFFGNKLRETSLQIDTIIFLLFPLTLWVLDRWKGEIKK